MRFAPLLALSLAGCSTSDPGTPPPLSLDYEHEVASADVSILYPITEVTNRDQLIAATEVGRYGELLPETSPFGGDTDGGGYDDMRVVSLRLDPCSARGACGSEVRVIYQPVLPPDEGRAETHVADGATHVFYAVPADELTVLLEQILTLKKAYGAGVAYPDALGPHPILAATGLDGEFAARLHDVLLDHLGEDRIVRITTMQHQNLDGHSWTFQQFDRDENGVLAPHTIVGVARDSQEIQGSGATDPTYLGGIYAGGATPSVPEVEALASSARPEAPTPELEVAFAKAIEVQHPAMHSSEDTDCGSCHLAEGARRAGEAYGFTPSGEFTSARSLDYVRDSIAVTNFHAFGYLGTAVSVMQRTANESALVADRMQADLAP